jgi:hypothetical protein
MLMGPQDDIIIAGMGSNSYDEYMGSWLSSAWQKLKGVVPKGTSVNVASPGGGGVNIGPGGLTLSKGGVPATATGTVGGVMNFIKTPVGMMTIAGLAIGVILLTQKK